MKATFAFVLSSCFLAAILAGKCKEQATCDAGTCCAGVPPFGGVCMPMSPEGGKCHVVDKTLPMFGDYFIGSSCPCDEGLVCVQEGDKKNNGICQVPPTTAAPTEAVADEGGDSDDAASDDAASDDAASAEAAPAEAAPAEAAPAEAAPAEAAPEAAPAEE